MLTSEHNQIATDFFATNDAIAYKCCVLIVLID